MAIATRDGRIPNATLVVSAFLGGMAGAAVIAITLWASPSLLRGGDASAQPSDPPATSEAAVSGQLLSALASIRDDLHGLELSLTTLQRRMDDSSTEPAIQADYTSQLHKIETSVERIAASLVDHDAPTSAATESRPDSLREAIAPGATIPGSRWRLWTVSQLLNAYGPPSSLTPADNGALEWTYEWPDGHRLTLQLQQGLAINLRQELPSK